MSTTKPLLQRLPIFKTLLGALHDDALILFAVFIAAGVGFALYGGPLTEQNLFVWVMVVAGSYLLAGRKTVEFLREAAYAKRGLIVSGAGAAIDWAEAALNKDLDDDIEALTLKTLDRYLASLNPKRPVNVRAVLDKVKQIASEIETEAR